MRIACLAILTIGLSASLAGNAADEFGESARIELRQLDEQLRSITFSSDDGADPRADVAIFLKAVRWALDFEPELTDECRQLIRYALRRAKDRMQAVAAGRTPWASKRGRLFRGFVSEIDDSLQPYGLIVPTNYDPAKPIRLDVVLHGSSQVKGISELLFARNTDGGDETESTAAAAEFIELLPLGRLGENAYRFEGETDIYEAIESVCRRYSIDRSRIVLRGSSLGGVGTWQMGLKRPDRFVALGPTSGPVDTIEFARAPWPHFVALEPLTPWQTTMLHLVDAIDYTANAGIIPVVAAMGDQDPYYATHLQIRRAFEREKIPFQGLVDVGGGHGIRPEVFEQQLRMLGAFAQKGTVASKTEAPIRDLRFVTWSLRYSRCHWLELLTLDAHYQRSELRATWSLDDTISLAEPINIRRLALHPPALVAANSTLVVGGKRVELPTQRGDASDAIVIVRNGDRWEYEGLLSKRQLQGKRPGVQGPIDDAFAQPFLCVRGTGQPWNSAIGQWADAQLDRFALEWRRHYRGDLRIKIDSDVTSEDLKKYHLILFGDPGSNSWIRELAPQLPISWTRDSIQVGQQKFSASEHGLQMICANPLPAAMNRYVVLNSGHTYHAPELRFSYMVFPRLGDWAIAKLGDPSTKRDPIEVAELVVTSGFFDEDWRIAE